MKKKIAYLILCLLGIMFYCCTPKLIPPTSADAERGKANWAECSVEKLTQAHQLYIDKCGGCHSLKSPESESEESWRKIVPPMAKKSKLTSEEERMILHYVLTMREAKK